MDKLMKWFRTRKRSEQLLVLAGVGVAVFGMINNVVMMTLTAKREEISARLTEIEKNLATARAEHQGLASVDPARLRSKHIAERETVVTELATAEAEIDRLTHGLVNASQMVQVLEHLLDTHKAITLEEIENLPVIALSFVDTEAREKDPAADVVKPIPEGPLYRHGMRVTLKGRYFDLVRYLASVEQLDLQIYWDRVTLDARTYPVARVTLELHTISADEAWFEV